MSASSASCVVNGSAAPVRGYRWLFPMVSVYNVPERNDLNCNCIYFFSKLVITLSAVLSEVWDRRTRRVPSRNLRELFP